MTTKKVVDLDAARELKLFIENDSALYRQMVIPIFKNLVTKMARGTYDEQKAVTAFMYLVTAGAKKYHKEVFGARLKPAWNELFDTPTRRYTAAEFAKEFTIRAEYGEYDYLLPKKYKRNKSGGEIIDFVNAGPYQFQLVEDGDMKKIKTWKGSYHESTYFGPSVSKRWAEIVRRYRIESVGPMALSEALK